MIIHNEKALLAHWVYTRDEWKTFRRKENRRKSLFQWLLHWIAGGLKKAIPEVKITSAVISVGNTEHHFNSDNSKLKRINILDEGLINVIEIRYDSGKNNFKNFNEIRLPVPRGKLKEAILVQEKLSGLTE